MSKTTIHDLPSSKELSRDDAAKIVGGNPMVARAAIGIAGYLGGKIIDAVVEDSGVLSPVLEKKDDGIYFQGKKLN